MSVTAQAEYSCTWDDDFRGNGNKGTIRIGDTAIHFSSEKWNKLSAQVESLTCIGKGKEADPPKARLRITECSSFCGSRDPGTNVKIEEGTILTATVGIRGISAYGVLYAWGVD